MLRRIHTEIGKSNEIATSRLNLERDRLAMEYPQWYKAGGRIPTHKKVKVEYATIEDWNTKILEVDPHAQERNRTP
ncbi:MAG: hypothetical protein ACREJN_21605 [Nitrospiraceae bacterium]